MRIAGDRRLWFGLEHSEMNFADRLIAAMRHRGNAVSVGIDPRPECMPPGLLDRFPASRAGVAGAFEEFGRGVVDAVAGLVPVVKFQAAFYEVYGPEGFAALHASVRYAHQAGLVVILDGKRNDIGTTAEAYARAYLGEVEVGGQTEALWDADALTVNPYLGSDGIEPFARLGAESGKGAFVLVRTSNASAVEFQDLVADGRPLYRHVAERLANWAAPDRGALGYSSIGAVVGATCPEQLAELRAALPGIIFLVPGYGAQGGSAQDVALAFDANGLGAIINSARGVGFAYRRPALRDRFGDDWQASVAHAAQEMIDDLAAQTPAGRLTGRPAPMAGAAGGT